MSEQAQEALPKIKISKDPDIQKRVETRRGINVKKHNLSKETANALARDTIAAEIRQKRKSEEEINELKSHSDTDILTGIYNRRGFEKNIKEELERAKRRNYELIILYLDADNFKEINDTLGHTAGDEYLVNIANAIKQASRHVDIYGRMGGDEFAILLSDTKVENVDIFWNRLNELFITKDIKISAGAAKVNIHNCSESINEADKAMYVAKNISKSTGENTLIRFDQLAV